MVLTAKRPGTEARREQILDAAIEVMGRKSYHWASTREIAEAAGVSERTLFFHFKSKKELYLEAVRKAHRDLFEALGRAAPPQGDIRVFLKMSERNFLEYLKEYPLKVKLLFGSLDAIGEEDLRNEIGEIFQSIYRLFFHIIEKAKERGEISEAVSTLSAFVSILGFHFVVSYAEFLRLDWFSGEQDVYSVVDVFADFITARGS